MCSWGGGVTLTSALSTTPAQDSVLPLRWARLSLGSSALCYCQRLRERLRKRRLEPSWGKAGARPEKSLPRSLRWRGMLPWPRSASVSLFRPLVHLSRALRRLGGVERVQRLRSRGGAPRAHPNLQTFQTEVNANVWRAETGSYADSASSSPGRCHLQHYSVQPPQVTSVLPREHTCNYCVHAGCFLTCVLLTAHAGVYRQSSAEPTALAITCTSHPHVTLLLKPPAAWQSLLPGCTEMGADGECRWSSPCGLASGFQSKLHTGWHV